MPHRLRQPKGIFQFNKYTHGYYRLYEKHTTLHRKLRFARTKEEYPVNLNAAELSGGIYFYKMQIAWFSEAG